MKFKNFILSALLTFMLLAASKTKADLIAYWPLDKIVEGKVLDATGNGYDGTVVGTLKPIEDANHKGLYFDGGASYIDCGSEGFDKINDQITISAWIKIEKFDKWIQTIVSKDGDIWQLQRCWGDNYYSVNFNLKTENQKIIRAGGAKGLKKVDDNKWHHIVGIYDGKSLKLYIDGKLSNSIAARKQKLSKLKNKLTIGENLLRGKSKEYPENSRSWHGDISQVAIFDHALTSSQVGLLYNTDAITCQKYSRSSDILSRGDIDLLKNIPQELFDRFIDCKKLVDKRKYPQAIKALDKLIHDNIASHQFLVINAFLFKYQIYIQQDDIENALKTIQTLQKTYPDLDSPEVTFSLAYCYIKQGNNIHAQTLLQQIVDDHPQSTYALKAQLCLSRIRGK